MGKPIKGHSTDILHLLTNVHEIYLSIFWELCYSYIFVLFCLFSVYVPTIFELTSSTLWQSCDCRVSVKWSWRINIIHHTDPLKLIITKPKQSKTHPFRYSTNYTANVRQKIFQYSAHDDVTTWTHIPHYCPFVRETTGDRWIPLIYNQSDIITITSQIAASRLHELLP